MNTIVLGIDTSTAVSVGLARGSEVLVSLHYDDPRAHAEQLMPLIHRGCEEAGIALTDIAEVAIGVGPGPYTGLRVGVATGRVLAHLAGLTPHPVCSLDILARQWAGVDGEFVWTPGCLRRRGRLCLTSGWSRSTCAILMPLFRPPARPP